MALVKENNTNAYTTLFDRYQPLIFVYACKITRDEEEASDIVQDVFLSLWERRATIEVTESILAYLYQSVKFKFFNLLDKKKVRHDYATSMRQFMNHHAPTTDNDIREREMLRILEKQIELLPAKLKQIYLMSRKENLDNAEIAQQLNISEKTVNNQLSIAVKILRTKIAGIVHISSIVVGNGLLIELLKKN